MSDVAGGSSAVRSSNPSHDGAFDLASEADTLLLLRHIHQSPLDPDTKNMLRDTVFAFRAEAGAVVTTELATRFSEYGFTLAGAPLAAAVAVVSTSETEKKPVSAKVQDRFGGTRKAPQFAPASVTAAPTAPKKVPVISQEPAPAPQESVAVAPQPTAPVAPAAPAPAPEPVPAPKPAEPVAAEPVVPEVPEVVPLEPVAPAVPEPTPADPVPAPAAESATQPAAPAPTSAPAEPVVQSTPTPAAVPDTPAAKRIKEIKHEVNQMVGNPVNLIDVHNEVGREYMNALLDAMKKSTSGSSDDVTVAMQRLEAAFAAVQETMGVHKRVAEVAPSVEKKESTVPKQPMQQAQVAPVATTPPVAAETLASAEPVAPAPLVTDVPPPEPAPTTAAPVAPVTPVPVPPTESVVVPAPETTQPAPVPVAQQAAPASTSAAPLTSVAKEKQVQEMMVAQKREAATTDKQRKEAELATMDPLMTPEVNAGLGQLLSEWTIFKHSGLFGTGPSGLDHPLYKKLAQHPMAAVVAGRFEGVTPQVKRSITDYMNGWRYEEGILHDQTETFETYLRRVIKHILDKRKVDSSSV